MPGPAHELRDITATNTHTHRQHILRHVSSNHGHLNCATVKTDLWHCINFSMCYSIHIQPKIKALRAISLKRLSFVDSAQNYLIKFNIPPYRYHYRFTVFHGYFYLSPTKLLADLYELAVILEKVLEFLFDSVFHGNIIMPRVLNCQAKFSQMPKKVLAIISITCYNIGN